MNHEKIALIPAAALLFALFVGAAHAGTGSCVVSDDFADETPAGTWDFAASYPSILNIVEQNGRVEFPSANGNPGFAALAMGLSSGWKVDMTTDWAVSGRWRIDPPFPASGDVGMAFVLVLEGDLDTLSLTDGFTLNAGVYNFGQGAFPYESTNVYDDGSVTTPTFFTRLYISGDVFIRYDAGSGCLEYDDNPGFTSAVQVCNIDALSPETEAFIGFLAYNIGVVPSFSGGKLRCDNFCLMYGNVVGSAVGACCIDGDCVQTIESSCAGQWQGAGVTCGQVDCTPQGACCLDDGACVVLPDATCATVGGVWTGDGTTCSAGACGADGACCLGDGSCVELPETSCAAALGAWAGESVLCTAGACGPVCVSDIDADNDVGFADLVELLFAWGPCPDDSLLVTPGGSPYLCETDGPWAGDSAGWHYSWREDFEDGALNTPGLSASAGVVNGPGSSTDSIDCDGDGVLDGSGTGGSDFFVQDPDGASVTFGFDELVLGNLPTRAGLVWTDGNDSAIVTFEAFDGDGALIGSFDASLGDGVHDGSSAADRFLGVEATCGISAIRMSASVGSVELDHVQYGYVPVCAADLDADCEVAFADLVQLLFDWGPCP